MKIALVQVASPDNESQQDRIDRVEALLRSIDGADLIVLPELWSAGYFHFDQYHELSETVAGPTASMCSRVAKDLGVYLHIGSIVESGEDGRLSNTSILLGPDGSVVHTYRKIHVFGYKSKEAELLTAGTSLPVADLPFGATAGITCYDLRFPGLWLELGKRGAEIIIVPAAWPAARREHWRLLTSARAVEHQIFVIACNAAGIQDDVELGGHSRVVDPSGNVLAEADAGETVLLLDIDPALTKQVREEFPVIGDRLANYQNLTA
ncbi:carbon-nitrogen family hydrolase [Paenarthrobacter sp. PAE-2]|jgi:predicted amidohydrolase|uniref:carbon-nitrogen family hydrolase n=1 Tax=Paenarthrobacter sp. PAE-2 TaxID=2982532 RepID=UPI00222F9777|nr:carbon-nitrogen family hydrolase [Paenarthrobacter sp. PAE-2]MCW3767115.1 carbon-nitrogen family hydrolase [Paenarthrobacter sp. PAE-2]